MGIEDASGLAFKKYTGKGTKVELQVGDLQATERYHAANDGVDIIVLNPRSLATYSGVPEALTIATGVVSITNSGSSYVIDTEGAASSDDLDTINGGNDGEVIYITSADAANDITIKHDTGNIFNPEGTDLVLGLTTDIIQLRYSSSLSYWVVISKSTGPAQTWQVVTGSRALSTTYTNTTGRPIQVVVGVNLNNTTTFTNLSVGGVNAWRQQGSGNGAYTFDMVATVPNGVSYSVSGGSPTLSSWRELR